MGKHLKVDGIEIHIEGEGAETIVMLHGWPDTYRVWDAQVAALKDRFRCVRFTLPGFDISQPRKAYSLDATLRALLHIINTVSPGQKVILMLHDWGCVFGYQFYMRHKGLVSSIIAVDIGDAQSEDTRRSYSMSAKLMIGWYQGTLAMAWKIGGPIGNAMTRMMANALKVPSPREYISCKMNFPYYISWVGADGSYSAMVPFQPQCPMLYIYGVNKPFMFHSPQWTEALAGRKGSKVVAMDSDHWPMLRKPEQFNRAVLNWLEQPAKEVSNSEEAA
ncbi:MAG: alpha/beta fold hydrolase [Sphingomonadaceae bacterium]